MTCFPRGVVMRELLSFFLLLTVFVLLSGLLHALVRLLGLHGLAAFMIYCIPMLGIISYTDRDPGKSFLCVFIRNALWGYSFILAVSGSAFVIDRLS